jgi:hypothetical protein
MRPRPYLVGRPEGDGHRLEDAHAVRLEQRRLDLFEVPPETSRYYLKVLRSQYLKVLSRR